MFHRFLREFTGERMLDDKMSATPTRFRIVAMAASAGGLNALTHVLADLGADFPLPILVVQHLDPRHRSHMAAILDRHTALTVVEARAGGRIAVGKVHLAPPDHHLLVHADGELVLTHTDPVHFVRPSADILFESAAASFRNGVIAVVLSGSGSDGAMGVRAVHSMGGTVIAQDEDSSEYFGMPGAAANTGCADFILPLAGIARALEALASGRLAA